MFLSCRRKKMVQLTERSRYIQAIAFRFKILCDEYED